MYVIVFTFSFLLTFLQGLDKLANWPSILTQFQKSMQKSNKTVTYTAAPEYRTPFLLLRLIARNNTTRNYTSVESNFLYAAMHIACMRDLQFPKEVCPDLPDKLDSLIRG